MSDLDNSNSIFDIKCSCSQTFIRYLSNEKHSETLIIGSLRKASFTNNPVDANKNTILKFYHKKINQEFTNQKFSR